MRIVSKWVRGYVGAWVRGCVGAWTIAWRFHDMLYAMADVWSGFRWEDDLR